jgi:hypothetical protein
MRLHEFRVYAALICRHIIHNPYSTDLTRYGYDVNGSAMKILSSQLAPSDAIPLLGFGLRGATTDNESDGFRPLLLSDISYNIIGAVVPGRTRDPLNYKAHILAMRRFGAYKPADLSVSLYITQNSGFPGVVYTATAPSSTAEFLSFRPPTALTGVSHHGDFSGEPILIQLTAVARVNLLIHPDPNSVVWHLYHIRSGAFEDPVASLKGSGTARYAAPTGRYELVLKVTE